MLSRMRLPLVLAAALSFVVHGVLLLAIDVTGARLAPPPQIAVPEAIPVELLPDPNMARRSTDKQDALAAALPLVAARPATLPPPLPSSAATPPDAIPPVERALAAASPGPPPTETPAPIPSDPGPESVRPAEPGGALLPAMPPLPASPSPVPAASVAPADRDPGPALATVAREPEQAAPALPPADIAQTVVGPVAIARVPALESAAMAVPAPAIAMVLPDSASPPPAATPEIAHPVADGPTAPPVDQASVFAAPSRADEPDLMQAAGAATMPPILPSVELGVAIVPPASPEAGVEATADEPIHPARDRTADRGPITAADLPQAPSATASPLAMAAMSIGPPAAMLHPLDPRPAVSKALDGLDCARIGATLDAASGTIVLKGHARSDADRTRLTTILASVPGIARVDAADLRVLGEPYCRLLTFLDQPALQRSAKQRGDLASIGAVDQPGQRRAMGGQPLDLTLSAPDFDAYLYVDYFAADGSVFHLLPSDKPDNHLAPDTTFRLGRSGERGRRAMIGPPYGNEIILVIAASVPLFAGPRPVVEPASLYLDALNGQIARLTRVPTNVRVEYAYDLLTTFAPP